MKRYASLLVIMLLALVTAATAQVTQEWASYYDAYGFDDYGQDIEVDTAGNIYVTGFCKNNSASGEQYDDMITMKYNRNGVRLWTVIYNGSGNNSDRGNAIAVDPAGNVYVTGRTHSGLSQYDLDYVTIKYNTNGVQQWIATYNGPYNNVDYTNDIVLDAQGNVYVTGQSTGSTASLDIATIKYDSNGVQQWVARYDGPIHKQDLGLAIGLDNSGNVYVTGSSAYTSDYPNLDYITIKYNSSGVQQWLKNYNNTSSTYDSPYDLKVDASGNAYVTGQSEQSAGSSQYDIATIKYDSLGNQKWLSRYNGSANKSDYGRALALDQAGNVYVTGYEFNAQNCYDMTVIKYNSSGVQSWSRNYNGPTDRHDMAFDIAMDKYNNAYITGISNYSSVNYYDCMTIKYDTNGTKQWEINYNGSTNKTDYPNAIAIDRKKNVYITGYSDTTSSERDMLTIRYSQILTDIDIVSIDSPADSVLSGRTYTPEATITNYEGDQVDFPVICEFDSSGVRVYCDTVEVIGLGGGDTIQVSFAGWTTGYQDGIEYSMRVFAASPDDGIPENDTLSKEVHAAWAPPDVGPISLEVPTDTAYLGVTCAPKATVKNFNEYPALSLDVVCEFSSVEVTMYSDTVHVTNLDSMSTTQIAFADWTPTADLPYRMKVFTLCDGDRVSSNDSKSKVVLVVQPVRDVAVKNVISPPSLVYPGASYTPEATVANFWSAPLSFDVVCDVYTSTDHVYSDTVKMTGLAGGSSEQVTFASWTAGPAEGLEYTVTVTSLLDDDVDHSNDFFSKTVTTKEGAGGFDVAVKKILSPPDLVFAGSTHTPGAQVANLSDDPVSIDVICRFRLSSITVYEDTVQVPALAPGEDREISFDDWTAGATEGLEYDMTVSCFLEGDVNHANDICAKEVTTVTSLADLDIQDYAGNLSANTMELTGVENSIVVGSYVIVNPDNEEKNVDLFDGPSNVNLDSLRFSSTDLVTYDSRHSISASRVTPNLEGFSSLELAKAVQDIVQVYIPRRTSEDVYTGTIGVEGSGQGSATSDEFTLKVTVVHGRSTGPFASSFAAEPRTEGNKLCWSNFGLGEQGFNLYRAGQGSQAFTRLNAEVLTSNEYTDIDVDASIDYSYKLGLVMASGSELVLGPLTLTSSQEIGEPVLEAECFNYRIDETEISYFLPKDVSSATLKIYDISGKLVKTLAYGSAKPGFNKAAWDGLDTGGRKVTSGVYFCVLTAGSKTKTQKIVVVR